jgi:hopanoid biosynthesis associated radical SAM protein HpnH
MKFPIRMTASLAAYILKNKRNPPAEWQGDPRPVATAGPFPILPGGTVAVAAPREGGLARHPMFRKRFPLVLMLEPLHACNLTCTGCGRIREYESTITERLPLEECLAASDECGAPVVSICGGEPMMYPQLGELVSGLLDRNRHIYLCTNGMFMVKRLGEFQPDRRFFFNVHLDGLEKTHDIAVEREGVFREAIEGIKAAKAAGFMVCTNTTIYRETDMKEIEALFEYLQGLGVDGHMISPAYPYSAVDSREIFLTRAEVREKFRDIDRVFRKYKLNNSPIYVEFLQGARELPCTAWGNPTYNVKGWKGPCYLITDGHYKTFEELMNQTPWENYGPGGPDPRCQDCMVHCGFEPSAAMGINARLSDSFKLLSWALR